MSPPFQTMFLARAALWLALFQGLLAKKEENEAGVEFIDSGTLSLATGSWNLLVEIDTGPLEAQVCKLRVTSRVMNEAVERVFSYERSVINETEGFWDEYQTIQSRKISDRVIQSWEPSYNIFEHEIDVMETEIKSMKLITQSRQRRSLIPIVGKGLGYLFGVATNEDIKKLVNTVDSDEKRQKDVIHRQERQLTLFKALSKEQKKQNGVLQVLQQHAEDMEDKLRHTATDLQLLPRFIVLVNRLSGLSRTLNENLGSFRQEISRLGHLINSLSKGSLTPGLMSSEELNGAGAD